MRMRYFVRETPKKGWAAQKVTRILKPKYESDLFTLLDYLDFSYVFFFIFPFFFFQDSVKQDIVAPTNGTSEDEGSWSLLFAH